MSLPRPAWLAPLVLASVTGCPLITELYYGSDEVEEEEVVVELTAREIEEKLALYVDCSEVVRQQLERSWERYTEHVDETGRPKRRGGAFIYPVPKTGFRTCNDTETRGPQKPPDMPELERKMAEVLEHAKRYAELSRDLDTYFTDRGFARDDWHELETTHPDLQAAFESWQAADAVLDLYLDTEKARNDPALLEELESSATDAEYLSRALVIVARPYVRCLQREPDLSLCEESFGVLTEAYGSYSEHYRLHRGEDQEIFWMRTFAEDADEFMEQANATEDMVRTGPLRKGDLDPLLDAHRRLKRSARTLRFDFP